MTRFRYVGPVEGDPIVYGGGRTKDRVFECPPQHEEKCRKNPEFEEVKPAAKKPAAKK